MAKFYQQPHWYLMDYGREYWYYPGGELEEGHYPDKKVCIVVPAMAVRQLAMEIAKEDAGYTTKLDITLSVTRDLLRSALRLLDNFQK